MPLLKRIEENNILLGVWHVTETLEELRNELLAPSFLGERYATFTSDARKLEFLAVRVLLKTLCGEEKHILYYPSGRPYLSDNSAYISISHTKGYVAVALSNAMVGVDIEYYNSRVERIATRFIRADEEPNLPLDNRIKALLTYWSAKETAFKLLDEEGVDWRDDMQVHPFLLDESGSFHLTEYKTPQNNRFLINYFAPSEFVLTWGSAE